MTLERFQERLDLSVQRIYGKAEAYYTRCVSVEDFKYEKHPVLKKGVTIGNKRSTIERLPSLPDLVRIPQKREYFSTVKRVRQTFYFRRDENGTLLLYVGYTSLRYVEEMKWDELSRNHELCSVLERLLDHAG